jgi:hypothetical protein
MAGFSFIANPWYIINLLFSGYELLLSDSIAHGAKRIGSKSIINLLFSGYELLLSDSIAHGAKRIGSKSKATSKKD